MNLQAKYYVRRKAFAKPDGDTYVKVVRKPHNVVYIVGFVLYDNGTIKYRQLWEPKPKEAAELIEAIQQQFDELSQGDFDKAEEEYLKREMEETRQWKESARIYFGIDVIEDDQKSVMDKVEKALKEEHRLRREK